MRQSLQQWRSSFPSQGLGILYYKKKFCYIIYFIVYQNFVFLIIDFGLSFVILLSKFLLANVIKVHGLRGGHDMRAVCAMLSKLRTSEASVQHEYIKRWWML